MHLMIIKVLISKKEIKMPNSNRCDRCNAKIDGSGNLCSSCRINSKPEKWTKADFSESTRQMNIKMGQMADDAERYRRNPN